MKKELMAELTKQTPSADPKKYGAKPKRSPKGFPEDLAFGIFSFQLTDPHSASLEKARLAMSFQARHRMLD